MKRRIYASWLLIGLGVVGSSIQASAHIVNSPDAIERGKSQFASWAGFIWFRCEDAATSASFSVRNYYQLRLGKYQRPIVPPCACAVEADVELMEGR